MEVLRKIFNNSGSAPKPYHPFLIPFAGGDQARAVYAHRHGDARTVMSALGLQPGPVIFVIGGAALMDEESMSLTRTVIQTGLAQFAHAKNITVIDGGTASGAMALMGMARKRGHFTYPLVGVAPFARVKYPGHPAPEHDNPLDPFHTHFVLTSGEHFGDESDMIARMATVLSGERQFPALGLVINGGQISRREVYMRSSSGRMIFPLLVMEGTGRLADDLAKAKHEGIYPEGAEAEFKTILSGNVDFVSTKTGSEGLKERLSKTFR
jgi:SLOG in TRPM, prokaryote